MSDPVQDMVSSSMVLFRVESAGADDLNVIVVTLGGVCESSWKNLINYDKHWDRVITLGCNG